MLGKYGERPFKITQTGNGERPFVYPNIIIMKIRAWVLDLTCIWPWVIKLMITPGLDNSSIILNVVFFYIKISQLHEMIVNYRLAHLNTVRNYQK